MKNIDYINNKYYKKTLESLFSCIPNKPSCFLITGATGLIGSFIIDLLYFYICENNINHKIIAIGRDKNKFEQRFSYITKNIYFFEHNLMQDFDLDEHIDFIIHAASNADPKMYAKYPVETIITNIIGTKSLLQICKKSRAKLILTSTFEVYGTIKGKDIYSEQDYGQLDNNLRACYPESKRTAELMLKSYVKEYNINASIVRLCSIYGPTMLDTDSKAHAQFLKNALNNQNIVLKSAGNQIRSYMYVADAVSAIFTVLKYKSKAGEVFNISNENSVISIHDFATIVAKISKKTLEYQTPDEIEKKDFQNQLINCILDNTKLKSIGWTGKYTATRGIKETLLILKNNGIPSIR